MLYDRRTLLIFAGFALVGSAARGETRGLTSATIDDLSRDMPLSAIGTRWQLFTDRVMGGVSNGTMVRETVEGRPAIRMRGDVSLENNGGFVQIALDLAPDGRAVDVSAWSGLELDVFGNGEEYSVHLRTSDLLVHGSPTGKASAPIRSGEPPTSDLRNSCRIGPMSPSTPSAYGVSA